MITTELIDRFQILLHQECSTYHHIDYLSPSHQLTTSHHHGESHFTEQDAKSLSEHKQFWRNKLCTWMYYVVDKHNLDRELVSIAMSYMDRYLSQCWTKRCRDYQLVAMTSLYLAMKLYRDHGRCAGISSFAKLSKGLFTEEEFIHMEQSMLDVLDWRMHPPTSFAFLDLLMHFLPRGAFTSSYKRRALFERIKFLIELSTTIQFFFGKKPSSVAIAAFIEVMEHEEEPRVSDRKYCVHFRKCVLSIAGVDCEGEEVVECREAMRAVHANAWQEMGEEMLMERDCSGAFPSGPIHRVVSP